MNLQETNSKLLDLYSSKLPNLIEMYGEMEKAGLRDFSCPLLLSCHQEYIDSSKRIVFIGEETNGWCEAELGKNTISTFDDIKNIQERYHLFVTSQSYKRPFWEFVYSINSHFNSGVGYMWSNTWKIGKQSGKGKADDKINELELKYFNVSIDEMRILSPDFIIFLTGPDYDEYIKEHFGNFVIKENYDDCFDELVFDELPCRVFRLYHPGYLRRAGLENKYREKLIQLLS